MVLFAGVSPFRAEFISESVLQRLIKKDIVVERRVKDTHAPVFIYKRGQPVDFFVLILQVSRTAWKKQGWTRLFIFFLVATCFLCGETILCGHNFLPNLKKKYSCKILWVPVNIGGSVRFRFRHQTKHVMVTMQFTFGNWQVVSLSVHHGQLKCSF